MPNSTAAAPPSQGGSSKVRAGGALRPVPYAMIASARIRDLTDAEARVVTVLEEYTGPRKAYCWPSVHSVAEQSGKSDSALRETLSGLERKGWIRRIRGRGRTLLGFVLTRRASDGAVAADTPEAVAQAAEELRLRKGAGPALKRREAGDSDILERQDPGGSESPKRRLSGDPNAGFPAVQGGVPSYLSEKTMERDQTIDRSSARVGPGTGRSDWAEADVDAKARELNRVLYRGAPSGQADRDWEQWQARYRGVARAILRGELTNDQVEAAIGLAGKSTTAHRGKRCFGAFRDILAGLTPGGRSSASPGGPVAGSAFSGFDRKAEAREAIAHARARGLEVVRVGEKLHLVAVEGMPPPLQPIYERCRAVLVPYRSEVLALLGDRQATPSQLEAIERQRSVQSAATGNPAPPPGETAATGPLPASIRSFFEAFGRAEAQRSTPAIGAGVPVQILPMSSRITRISTTSPSPPLG